MSRFAVVGCAECAEHWVIEDIVGVRAANQRECPRCRTRHSDDQLHRRARAETWEDAVEKRSALLATKRDAEDEFTDVNHYGDLEDEWNRDLVDEPLGVQVLEGKFSNDYHLDTETATDEDGEVSVSSSDHFCLGNLRCDGDAGLWFVQQYPAESSGTVHLDEESRPGELWRRLVDVLQEDIAIAVRELTAGTADGAAWQAIEAIIDDQLGMIDPEDLVDAEDRNGSAIASTLLSLCKELESDQHQQGHESVGPLRQQQGR